MLRASLFSLSLLVVLAGCSSDPESPAVVNDASTDTAVDAPDTRPLPDTLPADTSVGLACEEPLPSGFMCTAPTKVAGQTVCTEAALQELAEKCLNADVTVPAACAEWKAANAACASCVGAWSWPGIEGNIYPDDYLCYWGVMDAPCAKSVNCMYACEDTVCEACSPEPNQDGESDQVKCWLGQEKEGSKCWEVAAKDGTACFSKFDLSGCDLSEMYEASPNLTELKKQVVRFLRGACRDNGNWTNAGSAGDAGVTDAAGDAVSDTATGDTATTDAADAG